MDRRVSRRRAARPGIGRGPKLLRPIFKYHRRELGLLCKSAWQSLREIFQEVASDPSALPGVVISVQSYGDHLNLHPHVNALASSGIWSADGNFEAIPALYAPQLMLLFRRHLLKNLLACGRIGQATLDMLDRFRHPGFSAYKGEGISAGDSAARERLASCLVHAPFSLARLHYDRDAGIVTYEARASSRSNLPAPERFNYYLSQR